MMASAQCVCMWRKQAGALALRQCGLSLPWDRTWSSAAEEAAQPGVLNSVESRYMELVRQGMLRHDPAQWQVVQRLGRLYGELLAYRAKMAHHHQEYEQYQARCHERIRQLIAEEQQQQQQQQQHHREEGGQKHHPKEGGQQRQGDERTPSDSTSSASTSSASGDSWWQVVMGRARAMLGQGGVDGDHHHHHAGSMAASGSGGKPLTQEQRERLAALAREERVRRELGPPPPAPPAPKGLYLWGSVGSGKSLLMDMFFGEVARGAGLAHTRRVHFNAAMLEVHSHLHALDMEMRERQQQRAHLKQHQQQHQHWGGCGARGSSSGAAALLHDSGDNDEDDDDNVDNDAHDGDHNDDGFRGTTKAAGSQAVARFFDPEVQRQRDAKAAMLAIRRHLRLARVNAGSSSVGQANARVMARAAANLIRGGVNSSSGGYSTPNAAGCSAAASASPHQHHHHTHSMTDAMPQAGLLAFDEVQVVDVFSAVALKGLVETLTASGCVVVATSNRPPSALPSYGLHQAMFDHFVETLTAKCDVVELSAEDDYRRLLLEGRVGAGALSTATAAPAPLPPPAGAALTVSTFSSFANSSATLTLTAGGAGDWQGVLLSVLSATATSARQPGSSHAGHGSGSAGQQHFATYFTPAPSLSSGPADASAGAVAALAAAAPAGAGAVAHDQQLQALWRRCAESYGGVQALSVPVMFGRTLEASRACSSAAYFTFEELCARPLGAADYIALASRFPTVFLEGIPAMSMQVRDKARRFITLVDELYNARCVLVASAAVPPQQLFVGATGEEPILDTLELEGLQFETAAEGARLRRDVMRDGGIAPVAATPQALSAAMQAMGGAEERFAFRRAVSRLCEMQSAQYITLALQQRLARG